MANNDRFEQSKSAARDIKDTIKEGAAQVGSDLRQTATDARDAATDTIGAAQEVGPSVVESAKEKADDLRIQAQDALGYLYEDTVDAIRERPVAAVLIAALTGAVLALLARRSVS